MAAQLAVKVSDYIFPHTDYSFPRDHPSNIILFYLCCCGPWHFEEDSRLFSKRTI